MPKVTSATPDADGLAVAIAVARFNHYITSRLLEGAIEAFLDKGGSENDLHVVHVPGAFELPLAAKKLASSKKYAAVVCLGAVIRGDTPHFEYVCAETARGIMDASRKTDVPVAFGVLTTDTTEQALARISPRSNKGADAMLAALEMANVMKQLSGKGKVAKKRRKR
ncbi:MAG: 6,7-dimethyl-8-ribityllumazine synthase [Planctomycetaceae bacterium]|nr:6,7-dimethyl-8-ribityllumazine synthase [Planctomycetaceae bacterium]